MKSFSFEFQKLLFSKALLGLTVILFLGTAVLFYLQDGNDDVSAAAYKRFNSKIKGAKTEDCLAFLEREQAANAEELQLFFENIDFDTAANGKYTESLFSDSAFLGELADEISQVAGYDEFLQSVQKNAVIYTRISVFAQEGYARENIIKTAKDYESLFGTAPEYTASRGVGKMLGFLPRVLFQLFAAFFVAAVLFLGEKEKGLLSLCRSQADGRGSNMLARIISLFSYIFIWNLVYNFCCLLFASAFYGFPRKGFLLEPVQALFGFSDSVLKLNVISFLLLCLLLEWAASCALALFVILLGTLFDGSIPVYVICFLILAAEAIIYVRVKNFSPYENLRHINLIAFAVVPKCIGNYKNINISGSPVSLGLLGSAVLLSVFVLLLVLCPAVYSKCLNEKRSTTTLRPFLWLRRRFACKTTSLFRHEAYKLFVSEKAFIMLAAALAAVIFTYKPAGRKNLGLSEQFYTQYVIEFDGRDPAETDEEFNEFYESVREQALNPNDNFAEARLEGLDRLEEYREYLLNESDRIYVWSEGWERLFNDKRKNAELGILSALILILALAGMSSREKSSGMEVLLGSSYNGEKPVSTRKLILSMIVITAVFAMIYLRFFISINSGYKLLHGNVRADCIMILSGVPKVISIGEWAAFCFIKRFAALFLMGLLVMIVGKRSGSLLYTILICVGIVVLPLALVLMEVPAAEYILFNLLLI